MYIVQVKFADTFDFLLRIIFNNWGHVLLPLRGESEVAEVTYGGGCLLYDT